MLTVPELSGTFPKIYYENLGKTFYERKDYRRAAYWYERYLEVDSTHPRILANLSDCYRALGDKENVFRMLRLSVDANSRNPGVYSNLALEYAARGDTDRAVSLLNKALEFDPGHPISHANLSIIAIERRQYRPALVHAVEAIRNGMREPGIFKNAGYASYFVSDFPNAVVYLNEYLKSAPTDEKTKSLFDNLQRQLGDEIPGQTKPWIRRRCIRAGTPMKSPARLLFALCGLLIALHVAGTLFPTHLTWGLHFFAFYPPAVAAVAFVVSLLMMVPRFRDGAGGALETVVRKVSVLPTFVVNAALIGALVLLGYRVRRRDCTCSATAPS